MLKLLPPGTTSSYALYTDQYQTGAQVNLDGAAGLGMIRIFLYDKSLEPEACISYDQGDISQACSTLPSGAPVITTKIPGNCIESLATDVDHGQGTVVQIDLSTVVVRDDGEFVAFVERSGSRLCETAFLLCRDWNFAQDLNPDHLHQGLLVLAAHQARRPLLVLQAGATADLPRSQAAKELGGGAD